MDSVTMELENKKTIRSQEWKEKKPKNVDEV